ncbi:hypothetical protein [Sphingobium cloacae]|uniref:Uncharacterized protein n=1 Tax=Sphingobium cloacae TaxID=120107 RepID=A0A1E1F0V4_9SPHN|nr:hypothetical protein [Sphingobium cloacae]BAV64156.1 hypothetical protein SCLO_1011160 [Sphingobium cloacae]
MSHETAYRAAVEQAEEKKARFFLSAQAAKARVAPARLKQDAKDQLTSFAMDGVVKVRQHPVAAGAGLAAFTLYLARRPLAALFRRLHVRLRNRNTENEDG